MRRKWIKRILLTFAIIIGLVIAMVLFLQTRAGKNFVARRVEAYLSKKLKSSVTLGRLDYRIPNWVELTGILLKDKNQNTLLSGKQVRVDLHMFKLLSGDIEIEKVLLSGVEVGIYRNELDSNFNYQFLIDAFTSQKTDTVSEDKPLQISVSTIFVDSLRFKYSDAKDRKYYSANIGTLRGNMDSLDITGMRFRLNDWYLANTTVAIIDSSSNTLGNADEVVPEKESSPFFIQAETLGLRNVAFTYKTVSEKSGIDTKIDSLQLLNPLFNLNEQLVLCKSIRLNNSVYGMELVNNPDQKKKEDTDTTASQPWTIRCDTLLLAGNTFTYDNNFFNPSSKAIDYNHLDVKNISVNANDIRYVDNRIATNLISSSLVLNDKVTLKDAAAVVNFSDSMIVLKDALVAVNNSQIKTRGDFSFPLKEEAEIPAGIQLRLDSSFVSLADIETIAPGTLKKLPVALSNNDRVHFAGNLSGSIKRLGFQSLVFYTGNRQFIFRGNGMVTNATDPKKLNYQVAIAQFHADTKLLSAEMREKLREQSLSIPPAVDASGQVSGGTNDVNLKNFLLTTTYGSAQLNGYVKNFSNPDRLNYNIALNARELETGKWIGKDSLLGKLNGLVKVKGNGTKPETLVADLSMAIRSFVVKGYEYSNIDMVADYNKGAFKAKGGIDDENIVTQLNLTGNIEENNQSAAGTINVEKADLFALKLATDTFRVSTSITVDAQSLKPESLKAHILLDSSLLFVTGKRIYIDSVMVDGQSRSDSTFITMASPFIVASLNGKYLYNQLPAQATHYIQSNYFDKKDTVTVVPTQASFTARLTSHDFLTYINPDLLLEKPVEINASFDNRGTDSVLTALVKAAAFRYKTTGAEDVLVTVDGRDTALRFQVGAEKLISGSQNYLKPLVAGSFRKNVLNLTASTKDDENKDFYGLSSNVVLEENKTVIAIGNNLVLNGEPWNVAPDNSVTILKDGFIFNNLVISRGSESLAINNKTPNIVSPIDIKIDSFSLGSIVAFVNKDSLLADGKMDGDFTIEQPIQKVPGIKGDLAIQGLKVKTIPIGNAKFHSELANNKVELTGNVTGENEVTLKANADISSGEIDADVRLVNLNMNSVEAFSAGKINRGSGKITGFAIIDGTITKPTWKGELNFNDAAFALTDFNSLYRIKQEKITFEYPNIRLDQFQITDSLNNPLTINGSVTSLENGTFGLDMSIRARNFIAINAPKRSTSVIYGTGIMDANVTVEGTSAQPSIQGSATLEKGSDVYYIIPQKNNYADERNEIVTFIKADTIQNLGTKQASVNLDSVGPTIFQGLKYNLNLQVQKEATLTVVVDPLNNDELQIQGTAQINAGIDEGGRVGLNGVYNLESGYYNMNYKLIKRKFELVKGSTITFSGDPKDAVADITAQYETDASVGDLLGNEVADGSTVGTTITTKVPFLVMLTIKGSLLKPELGFDIKLKEGAEGVNATVAEAIENKLTQIRYDVSAMNKQVFGLLIMNRFISDRSSDFFGGSGFRPDAVARESVSRFLTEAVNQIANDLIKGVDIDVNLKNYESVDNSINRTDVDVALSKRLFNDRLSISVGKNFTVDGSNPAGQTQANNNVQQIPDITTSYKLSRDGRYVVRAYRRNQYEAQVDGYFIETGAVFSITMDYNRFRELFQKRRPRNQNRNRDRDNNNAPTTGNQTQPPAQ